MAMSFVLACLLSVLLAGAQEPNSSQAIADSVLDERVIGLLNLPEIVGDGCGPSEPTTVSIYASPSKEGRSPIGSLEMPRSPAGPCQLLVKRVGQDTRIAVPYHESGYELPAAIVYERRGRWFRIALDLGSAWIDRDPVGFLPYPALLKGNLAYLVPNWDGLLRQAPGAAAPLKRLSPAWKAHLAELIPIELLGVRRVGGETWLHVQLGVESCGEVFEGVKPVEGWVPAYRSDGDTNAWFASRGC
jgi:hypothetical protein